MNGAVLLASLLWLCDAQAGNRAALTYVSPAERGEARAQIELTDPSLVAELGTQPSAHQFRAVITNGDARVQRAWQFDGQQETVHTVLAFDRSGSFRSHWDDAFALAGVFADHMPNDGSMTVSVMTFHSDQRFHGVATTPGELRGLLTLVRELNTLGSASETSLMSAVRAGVKHAAENQTAAGSRQLIVFSDGGEEGAVFRPEETALYARELGTAVHPIVIKQVITPGSTSAQRFAMANDRMKRLAEETGGQHLHVSEDSSDARSRLASHATVLERLYWLELDFCGVKSDTARFQEQLYIDIIENTAVLAHTDTAPFTQHAAASAIKPCAALADPPQAPANDPPSPPPTANNDPPGEPLISSEMWMMSGLIGTVLLLLLLGALLLMWLFGGRRKGNDRAAAAPAPEPPPAPPPEPEIAQSASSMDLSPAWQDPFESTLPETRLVLLTPVAGLQSEYRIHKAEFVLGADPSRDLDLVFPVPQVSGRHATIQLYRSGSMYVTDHHSSNGTFVDGQPLQKGERRQVFPGQTVSLSRQVRLRLAQPSQADAPRTPPPPKPTAQPTPAAAPKAPPPSGGSKTIYGPMGTSAPQPKPTQNSDSSRPKRKSASRTIIQPLSRDDQ